MYLEHDNKEERRLKRAYRKRLIVAFILIAGGLLWTGKNAGVVPVPVFRALVSWQMLLIVLGLAQLLWRNVIAGACLIGIGLFFLMPLLSIAWSDWWHAWGNTWYPSVFVLVGLFFLFRRPKKINWRCEIEVVKESTSESKEGFVDSQNSFGSTQQIVMDPVFKGGRICNRFGATVWDLRRTSLADGETFIDVDCFCGGVEIWVPEHWMVVTDIETVLAGLDDKRIPGREIPDANKKLIIRGKIVLSGIELKN